MILSKREDKTLNVKVVGTHTIEAIIKNTPERALLLSLLNKNNRLEKLKQAALKANIKINFVSSKKMKILYKEEIIHQGALLTCKAFKYVNFNKQLEKKTNLVIILDGIQDSRNLGRASRSALCFKVDLIVIPKNRSAEVNIAAEKAAVGALSQIPITKVANLTQSINILKEKGFFIVGAEAGSKLRCYKYKFGEKVALVFGGENSGIRQIVKKNCDEMINIPMKNKNLNLNAADSVAIILYEISRQRYYNEKK